MENVLDFSDLQERCIRFLDDHRFISVATSFRDRVRARVVDFVNDGLEIGFLTWGNTTKVEHIMNNPNVSLCIESLQVDGKASICGHPLRDENRQIMKLYEERHPSPFRNFISRPDSLLVRVEPLMLVLMKYENRNLCLDHLDIAQKQAYRTILSPWDPS